MINNISVETAPDVLEKCFQQLYRKGPVDGRDLEEIAYCKLYFPEIFNAYEQKILLAMGMFYKTNAPETLFEKALNIYREAINDQYGHYYTPDQTLIRKNIAESLYYSFSAPTSSGKSHVFRDLIEEATEDIVVIVPSRALISEYYLAIIELVSTEVLVLTFVDDINRAKTKRRIFILTPERATELFKYKEIFNIGLFLFDEAQLTEEKIRGLKFDALVRRTIKEFPLAKKVFAHPFVTNPEIHFEKHSIKTGERSNSFLERAVGQLFYYEDDGNYYLYSPYEEVRNLAPVQQDNDVISRALANGGSVLIYIAKSKIYDLRFLSEFKSFLDAIPEIQDSQALALIEKLRSYLGANKSGLKQSLLINLMKKGVVLHHGSIPLKGRLIIEEFIKKEYARICFATSTLLRGINMPFDVVYIDNFRSLTPLDFKNLIGRAGRTNSKCEFNIGSIVCNKSNVKTIMNKINEDCRIEMTNNLDNPVDEFEEDDRDLVYAIKNDEFVDELNIPKIQYDRYADSESAMQMVEKLIGLLIPQGTPLSGEKYSSLPDKKRKEIKNCFRDLYVFGLRNQVLTADERSVLSTALHILLWKIQGKSFRQTVRLRYSYVTNEKELKELRKKFLNQELTELEYNDRTSQLEVRFTPAAFSIPNKRIRQHPVFQKGTSIDRCGYDRLVYDTYDYLDKVIALSIADPICAALEIYYQKRMDLRAKALQNYIRYGTNSKHYIMIFRYGFDFEDLSWLTPCIDQISEDGIKFNDKIKQLSDEHYRMISRYL